MSEPEQAQSSASTSSGGEPLAAGSLLGRFRIVRHLGRGGMGAVYEAEDTVRERHVAMKVVTLLGSRGRERMLAEARALERIKHANVVRLYDVGVDQDRVYLALELVRGSTLAQWLKRDKRSWSVIVDHFVASGRGLAKAHHSGLAHGDFKPSNVLVSTDGRVLVSDFGLAQSMELVTGEQSLSTGKISTQSASTHSGSDQSTLPGHRIVGTPAYMAPELFRGGLKGSATDQFAFCVALYEALYDAHPFGGGSWHEVARAIGAGELRVPPRDKELPRHIRRAVLRGLAQAPSERWPSMHALLRQLTRPHDQRKRTRNVVVFGSLGGAGLVGLVVALTGESPDPISARCDSAARALETTWDVNARTRVAKAFSDAKPVTSAVDRWSEAWTRSHGVVCDAERRTSSQQDTGLQCLDSARAALQRATSAMAKTSGQSARSALQTIAKLPDPVACAD